MENENHLIQVRRDKVDALRERGMNPYQNKFKPTHKIKDLLSRFSDKTKEELEAAHKDNDETIIVAGRVMFAREFGKLTFFRISDGHSEIQCSISLDGLGEEAFQNFGKFVDVGDIVGVVGRMTKTQKGELTVKATSWEMITKSVRPLPDKWHGLTDTEQRYRQRYVDLIMNADVRDVFRKRSEIIRLVREYMHTNGYMEVETPILQHQAGGAAARPFLTHHNALDIEFKLRIAPELDLKRLVVGGYDRVFELGRLFRNEGVSTKHNPEFTSIEGYAIFMDLPDVMDIVEGTIRHAALGVCENGKAQFGEHTLDFNQPFKRMTMRDALIQIGGATEADLKDEKSLDALAKAKGIHVDAKTKQSYGDKFAHLFEELCEAKLIQPTFIYDYPISTSPLARTYDENPEWAERSELFICGREAGNMFSELNDPADQAQRFQSQIDRASAGDDEAMPYDHDYIRALEYGMPSAGGFGIGIDRLIMTLTGQESIRDVLFFPHQKPENE